MVPLFRGTPERWLYFARYPMTILNINGHADLTQEHRLSGALTFPRRFLSPEREVLKETLR